jgi:alpha-tubulin suppressor-like RCC1 family protein
LGHGEENSLNIPKQIQFLNNLQILQVSCGDKHSAFLTTTSFLYMCGSNESGQLGLGGLANVNLPTILDLKVTRYQK